MRILVAMASAGYVADCAIVALVAAFVPSPFPGNTTNEIWGMW
jgi:hypothetical protein